MGCDNIVFIAWEGEDGEPVLLPFTSPALPADGDILNIVNVDTNTQTRYMVTDVEYNITMSEIEEEVDLDNVIICVIPIEDMLPYSEGEL